MNFDEINKIIDKFNQSQVRELNLDAGDFHLHLSKNENAPVSSPVVTEGESKHESLVPSTSPAVHETTNGQIKSPMVGTVYLQPEPDAAQYVKTGDTIHEGDVVCIIEAMKLMTEVKSNTNGKIKNVLVNDGEMVEFDQPLFEIEEA